MVKMIGSFEEVIEKGQTTLKKSAKQNVKVFAQTAANQITGSQQTPPQNSDQGTNEQASSAKQNSNQQGQMTDRERVEFLRNLYGSKSSNAQKNSQGTNPPVSSKPIAQTLGISQKDPNAGKSPEEIAKIESLRKQLHGQYYEELTNPPKQKEEHVTEKLEREEQEEQFAEIEKEKKKPPKLPVTVKQGTGESVVGVSG